MRKYALVFVFFIFSYPLFSQVWLDVFTTHSSPAKDFFASGNVNLPANTAETEISNKELF